MQIHKLVTIEQDSQGMLFTAKFAAVEPIWAFFWVTASLRQNLFSHFSSLMLLICINTVESLKFRNLNPILKIRIELYKKICF